MKLADKPCYPKTPHSNEGLTFRERLIIALAGNPNFAQWQDDDPVQREINARDICKQADTIIKRMEK